MPLYIDLAGHEAILKGETFTLEFVCVDENGDAINLAGYSGEAIIKRSFDDSDAEALLTLTQANGRIVITPTTGSVVWYLADNVTAALEFSGGVHFTRLTSAGGDVTYIADGTVQVQTR